jgi:hypothetical protein
MLGPDIASGERRLGLPWTPTGALSRGNDVARRSMRCISSRPVVLGPRAQRRGRGHRGAGEVADVSRHGSCFRRAAARREGWTTC